MTATTQPARASSPNVVLAMLLLVYIFNFLDRQILSILAAPIQRDLGLSDTQMGLLGGIAFAGVYSILAVPLARIADRTSRSGVIAISLGVWSLCTALCGMAQNYAQLFLARLGVGVGEAGGVAPSYALISDYFPQNRRAFASAIYSLGIPLGSAIGVLAGAYIATKVDWRTAFVAVGIAGVVLAPIFRWLVRDRVQEPAPTDPASDSLAGIARLLAAKPSFWLLAFGAASSSMVGYGLAFWMPSVLQRSFGLTLVETAQFIAGVLLIGGVAGIVLGGVLADWLGSRDRAWYAWVPAIAFALAVPPFAFGIGATSVPVAFVLILIPQALVYIWLGPVISAVQHLVAPPARSTASSLFLLINNLLGLGGGIYALGALSDVLKPVYGSEALRISAMSSLALYGLAALLMGLAGLFLKRDWRDG